MAKQLTCECGTNCGEMRDGRFIKGGLILCPKCAEQYRVLKMIQDSKGHKTSEFDDMFKDVFGSKVRGRDLFGDVFKGRK